MTMKEHREPDPQTTQGVARVVSLFSDLETNAHPVVCELDIQMVDIL